MTRRYFLAAIVSCLAGTASAQYIDPAGYHRHQCPNGNCSVIWQHNGKAGSSHNCWNCGNQQLYQYQGPLGPTPRAMATQPVVVTKPKEKIVPIVQDVSKKYIKQE